MPSWGIARASKLICQYPKLTSTQIQERKKTDMKKLSAAAILVVLVCSYSCTNEPKQESTNTEVATAFEDQYINLQGEWHFRVYRKYENMFQLFNHGGVNVVWEDLEVAKIPTTATCSSWETVTVPSPNYSTGGLQQMRRGTDMDTDDDRTRLSDFDVFPNWSEAWFCRTCSVWWFCSCQW